MEPLLRGHVDERPTPLERPLDTVNLKVNVLISTPDERPPLSKDHCSGPKGMASQEGFRCTLFDLENIGLFGVFTVYDINILIMKPSDLNLHY